MLIYHGDLRVRREADVLVDCRDKVDVIVLQENIDKCACVLSGVRLIQLSAGRFRTCLANIERIKI